MRAFGLKIVSILLCQVCAVGNDPKQSRQLSPEAGHQTDALKAAPDHQGHSGAKHDLNQLQQPAPTLLRRTIPLLVLKAV